MSFTLCLARCGVPTIAASPLGHGQTGVTVSLTGSTSACGSPTYRFLVGRSGRWSVVQGYTAGATYGWSSTGMAAGALQLEVDVRDQNSSSSYDGWAQIPYTLNACSTAHVTAGQTSPQPAGTTIALNATATCPGTPEYRFWAGQGGRWSIVQDYSTAYAIGSIVYSKGYYASIYNLGHIEAFANSGYQGQSNAVGSIVVTPYEAYVFRSFSTVCRLYRVESWRRPTVLPRCP